MKRDRDDKRTDSERLLHARRTFLGGVAALPALSLLGGCMSESPDEPVPASEPEALALNEHASTGVVSGHERAHRTHLALARIAAANRHDLERLLKEYAHGAELVINGDRLTAPARIREALTELGLSTSGGGLADARLTARKSYVTDEEILVYGRLTGRHVGVVAGFTPTGRPVEIALGGFYRFSRGDKLVSERYTLNFGILSTNLVLPG